ncbi:MAG: ferrous iron transport protein B [Actinomycetaceae bacterium]|nr:ferrous iron transport protein B [Actinomycetaceae bacterium]
MSCPHCGPGTALVDDELATSATTDPTIVLLGNPNVGKSCLFNLVTGARQAVVNAPGTTVEMMAGRWSALRARILDLPGTYSLIATSPDEQVVVDTLAGAPGSFTDPESGRNVDLAVVLLDATALTRSLYLLGQVGRTGCPVVAVLTMADVQAHEGEIVNADGLAAALGVPVMVIDPRSRKGIAGFEEMVRTALATRPRLRGIDPAPMAPGFNQKAAAAALQKDGEKCQCAHHHAPESSEDRAAEGCCQRSESEAKAGATEAATLPDPATHDSMAEADLLFTWVEKVEKEAQTGGSAHAALSRSDKIDRFLLHPVVGIPVFFALMWVLFKVAGEWVGPIQDLFDSFFTSEDEGAWSLANALNALLAGVNLQDTWVQGLLVGGLATGLGVVASFLPLMFIIFLMISILEDSGYMARAAFLGDRLMRAIGLDGRVIMPLIMGFGCNLPSLAATRTLPSAAQRLVTTLIVPYASCAARLTIYLMIARIFFPENTGTVVFAMYVLSLAMIVIGALILRPFFTRGENKAPLMLVLPAYQMPRPLVALKNTWMRAWAFVKGAGKIIVVMTLVVWLMGAIPMAAGYSFADPELPMEDSLYGRTAQTLVPAFAPAGFGEWHMTGALMTGFVAKETVISSIVTSYNLDPEVDGGDAEDGGDDLGSLPELVTGSFASSAGSAAPVAAFAFLVFVLTYTPCLATVAEQARQVGGKLAAAAVVVQLAAAWTLAVLIFQIGRLFF